MSRKKILVCGATGFIGRNTAETLAKRNDFEIYGTYLNSKSYKNSKIKMIKANLTNKKEVQNLIQRINGLDVIVQMAAYCTGAKEIVIKPYIHVTDNVIMNSLIFREAFEQNVKHIIYPSTSTMYASSDTPIKEEDFDPNKIPKKYLACGQYKIYMENQCKLFSEIGKTKHTIFRNSNIYGPYDEFGLEKSHVFGATITKVMTSKEGDEIIIWGTGEEERDLIYVSDVVSIIKKSIDKQTTPFELVNVGLGKSISVSNLVKKIIKISGKDLKIKYDPSKPTIKTKVCFDCSKAKEKFDWFPKVSLEEGIKKTIDWYKKEYK